MVLSYRLETDVISKIIILVIMLVLYRAGRQLSGEDQ
jgi:hypothetical protein